MQLHQEDEPEQFSNDDSLFKSIRQIAIKHDLKTIKVLDNKFVLIRTLGVGRYAIVKLAYNIVTNKQVAIKILKTQELASKSKSLELLMNEVRILSKCDHPNIVRIYESSFDGFTIKYQVIESPSTRQESLCNQANEYQPFKSIKRKSGICYYSMKLAKYGELYKFIEQSDRFSEKLSRTLFTQLLRGIEYLTSQGICHRDIKPENLLIDNKMRLIIVDFGFAIQLQQSGSKEGVDQFKNVAIKTRIVGSEEFNAPELNSEEIKYDYIQQQIFNQKSQNQVSVNKFPSCSLSPHDTYDPFKADIFSMGATLFLMTMRSPPFRKAVIKDPYYKRLQAVDTRQFWNIFKGIHSSVEFKDLIERITRQDPDQRLNFQQILNHPWIANCNIFDNEELKEEIQRRYDIFSKQLHMQQYNQQQNSPKSMMGTLNKVEEEQKTKDEEEFEQFRVQSLKELFSINERIKDKRKLNKINKIKSQQLNLSSLNKSLKSNYSSKNGEKTLADDNENITQRFLNCDE